MWVAVSRVRELSPTALKGLHLQEVRIGGPAWTETKLFRFGMQASQIAS